MGVVQHFHDLHLAIDLLQVYRVQLGLVDDLYGHLLKKTQQLADSLAPRSVRVG